MSAGTLYDQVLAQVSGGPLVSLPQPRPSASVVLWRGNGDELEVYWAQRSPTMKFMGGWHAFPGGVVSRRDAHLEIRGEPTGVEGAPEHAGMPESVLDGVEDPGPILAPGVVATALREVFEEVGVLPGIDETLAADRRQALRAELVNREVDFPAAATRVGCDLDASALVYAGRWLTPPLGPVRFDNRFFLLEWPADESVQPAVDKAENVGGEWIRPSVAIERWRRGEVLTAPPILHLLEVLGSDGPVAGLDRMRLPTDVNLGPFRVVEFRPGVVLLPVRTPTLPPAAFTNCYLFGLDDCVLVDPGSPFEREIDWLVEAIAAAPEVLGRRVREIWLTHHHPDHVGGAAALRERTGLPIAAHAATAERLEGVVAVNRHIEDGERTPLGDGFTARALHTPGHARGHLSFLHEELGSLLVGDVVAGYGTIVIDPPEGEMEQYLGTLATLAEIAPRTLFPGHGPTLLDAVGRLEEYRRHRLWREQKVLAAWQAGEREPAAIRDVVYDDLSPMAFPLAERQIVAHLERLEALGQLEPIEPA